MCLYMFLLHWRTLLTSFLFTCFNLGKRGSALHTSVIRIGTQWFAACSVIRNFKVERLPVFSWSQNLIRSQQIEDCDSSNSTSCQDSLTSSFKYPWPAHVTAYIANLFDIEVIPRVASVQFAAACRAEELFPGNPIAKMVAPGIYYVLLPLIAVLTSLVLCVVLVYIFIPIANRWGLHFNLAAKQKHARRKAIKKLKKTIAKPLEDTGLTWSNLEAGTWTLGTHCRGENHRYPHSKKLYIYIYVYMYIYIFIYPPSQSQIVKDFGGWQRCVSR